MPVGEIHFDLSSNTGASSLSEIHFHSPMEGELRARQSNRHDWKRSVALPIPVLDPLVSLALLHSAS